MDLALREDVHELLNTVVWFANLRRISSAEKVARRFYRLHRSAWLRARKDYPAVAELQKWQETTRLMLMAAMHYGRSKADEQSFDDVFSKFLKHDLELTARLSFGDGELREQLVVAPKTVWAFCRLGSALLTDQKRGYKEKLRTCPTCNAFALDWESRRGRPPRYCSPECKSHAQRQQNAQRQQKFRERSRDRATEPKLKPRLSVASAASLPRQA
jgi:hypothetical protein